MSNPTDFQSEPDFSDVPEYHGARTGPQLDPDRIAQIKAEVAEYRRLPSIMSWQGMLGKRPMRTLATVIVLAGFASLGGTCFVAVCSPTPPAEPKYSAAEIQELRSRVQKLVDAGILTFIHPDHNWARADISFWLQMDVDQKTGLVIGLSQYFDAIGSSSRVEIRSSINDTVLASYSAWSGVNIKI